MLRHSVGGAVACMHALYMYARAYLARDSKVLTMADISVKKKNFDAAFKLKVVPATLISLYNNSRAD